MFSDALLISLRKGHNQFGRRISVSELGDLVSGISGKRYPQGWVRPEVHSPEQRDGEIARIPMFPNAAYGARGPVSGPRPKPDANPFPLQRKGADKEPRHTSHRPITLFSATAPRPAIAQMSSSAPSAQARSVRMFGFHSLPIFARHGTARTLRRIAAKLLVSQLSGPYRAAQSTTLQKIVQGTEIGAIPIFSGCTVEPKSASVASARAWHRLEFEFQWQLTAPPAGAVFFFVGLVLVGEVPVRFQSSLLPEHFDGIEGRLETRQLMDSVFVSYSRKDVCIVEELERAFRALGLRYLRDVRELRAGQEWAAELLNMIDRAEAYQLCWSRNAKRSVQVDQEWRHALHSHVTGFIPPSTGNSRCPRLRLNSRIYTSPITPA